MNGPSGPSRRGFLGAALGGIGVVAAGGGYGIARATAESSEPQPAAAAVPRASGVVPFYGEHQAGIATPAQDRVVFAAFDLTTDDVEAVKTLLGSWAAAAAQMTSGQLIGVDPEAQAEVPPNDTGEALGLPASQLTITVGFGPSLFDKRFGLGARRPAALVNIPAFPTDALDPARGNGDLGVQACANDPMVAFHAIRNFTRIARGTAVMRWSQQGFGKTSGIADPNFTGRNLMGFIDGTNNIAPKADIDLAAFVWVGDETDQPWMHGGSYLVSRRIRMHLEAWDADGIADQEGVIGRRKDTGAPLTGAHEHDTVDLAAAGPNGPLIPVDAHIRLAAPATNGGQKILRRGYHFTDGADPLTGQIDAGLFFLAYQKDVRKQFIPIQKRLSGIDALNEYIRHTSSGIFAVPPGLRAPGDWYGQALFS
jgi:deferrochelatase/peroxidase EfeB